MPAPRPADRHVGRWFGAGPLVVALLATACAPEPRAEPGAVGGDPIGGETGRIERTREEAAPIVVISIDTLRSDRLPAYGYDGVATPAIDRLAADGVVFERAFSHSPLTLPSHASLFSGLLPSRHGIRDNPGYRVPDDIEWLPETLRAAGYATAAMVSSSVLAGPTGMSRGFDVYDDGGWTEARTSKVRPGSETVAAALDWMAGLDSDLWLLFVHLYEPHQPYRPPPPFDTYPSAYDGEIATADAAVGTLLDGLEALGLYDRAVIVLTSDHGEGLGEHGERDHGIFVYRESLQVPLILKLPGGERAGERIADAVQIADVSPTLVELAGTTGTSGRPGTSLLAARKREPLIYAESYLPRLYFGASELHTLIGSRLQYIDSPEPELFDLLADPAGLVNLADQYPEVVAERRARLADLVSELEAPAPVDAETRRRLASLGYLGGAAPPTAERLPAPSTQIELLEVITDAYDAISRQDYQTASEGFRRAVDLNPMAAFAWSQLAETEEALGRHEEALEAALMAIELTDEAVFRLIPAARLALKTGDLDRAEELARRAAEWSPAESSGVLARVALGRRDLDAARDHSLAALDADPEWTPPALQTLSVYLRAGRPGEALRFAEEIEVRVGRAPAGLNLMVGDALVQLGRPEDAVEWVEREIELHPARPRPYGYLATLHGRLDEPEQAGEAIDRLLANVPGPARYVTGVRTLLQLGFPGEAVALLGLALEEYPSSPDLQQLAAALESAEP